MKKEGSILGGVLLIAGCCIGAGMLALPVVTGIGGFIPSIILMVFIWLFMATTGMLLLEANLALGVNLSLISLAEKTLGKPGKSNYLDLLPLPLLFPKYCLHLSERTYPLCNHERPLWLHAATALR